MRQSQNPLELQQMLQYIRDNNIRSILEIGSRYGETLWEMALAMPVGSRVVSVELANGPWGRPDSLPQLEKRMKALTMNGYDARLILGNSRDADIVQLAKVSGPYDFIFIDGDHTYEGAFGDWTRYADMGRHIGFHDVNTDLDVAQVWRDITLNAAPAAITEFIAPSPPRMGIGIIDRGSE